MKKARMMTTGRTTKPSNPVLQRPSLPRRQQRKRMTVRMKAGRTMTGKKKELRPSLPLPQHQSTPRRERMPRTAFSNTTTATHPLSSM